MPAPEAIDYYCVVHTGGGSVDHRVGTTVIFGFRPQVFVTRGLTAAIAGVSSGSPRVLGIWAANGAEPLSVRNAAAR